ncbi:hypothetical protein D917_03637 [Trichinella nativa]|uniref:Uncharacterized protein n=1 Tax=Trichinella nativa TaxID=6335 RepID=A0A1Y3EBT1_9BILA|nr:hypothetical protein D917_03637 [Trichinella nativa]
MIDEKSPGVGVRIDKELYKATLYGKSSCITTSLTGEHEQRTSRLRSLSSNYRRWKNSGRLDSDQRNTSRIVADRPREAARSKREQHDSGLLIGQRLLSLICEDKRCGCSQFRKSDRNNIRRIVLQKLQEI